MPVTRVLAGVAVEDVEAAEDWWGRLFGRPPDDRPAQGIAEWRLSADGVVQLVAARERAGASLLTLEVEDLEAELCALRDRGIDCGDVEDDADVLVLMATVADPEGSVVTLVQRR